MMPIIGVIIADYWIIGRGNPQNFDNHKAYNAAGIFSWLAGYAIIKCIPFGIPYGQGIAGAMLIYVLLKRWKANKQVG